MITISHIVNVLILLPVCTGLLLKHPNMERVFGEDTTARQILLSMYLSIAILSVGCLSVDTLFQEASLPLFTIQVIYKVLSLILISNKRVPVYWFNAVVIVIHSYTLWGSLS